MYYIIEKENDTITGPYSSSETAIKDMTYDVEQEVMNESSLISVTRSFILVSVVKEFDVKVTSEKTYKTEIIPALPIDVGDPGPR